MKRSNEYYKTGKWTEPKAIDTIYWVLHYMEESNTLGYWYVVLRTTLQVGDQYPRLLILSTDYYKIGKWPEP